MITRQMGVQAIAYLTFCAGTLVGINEGGYGYRGRSSHAWSYFERRVQLAQSS